MRPDAPVAARVVGAPLWARVAVTLVLGAIAAGVCVLVHTPLPWMVGPLVVSALGSMAGLPLVAATPLRNAAQCVIGIVLGLYFTPRVVALVVSHWGAVLVGIAWALALGASFGAFLRRANPANASLDAPTLFFASAIGGASEMAVLAERHGGRIDLVASAHSLRVLIVVLTVPFALQWAGLHGLDATPPGPQAVRPGGLVLLLALAALGGLALRRLQVSNAWMLGALAVAIGFTASGVALSALPKGLTNAAQLVLGVSLGTRFTPAFLHSAPRWLATVAAGTLAMMVLSAGYAWVVAQATELHPATVLLGTSPGGIAEMCITAQVLQLGVPVVTAFHVTRMAAVVMLVGPLFRWRRKALR